MQRQIVRRLAVLGYVFGLTALTGVPSLAAPPPSLSACVAGHAAASALLKPNTIRVRDGGNLAVQFESVVRLLEEPDLLRRIQDEYARTLPAGASPEFMIQTDGDRTWSFVNRHGQTSRVEEVARIADSANRGGVRFIFYARGERFFGDFESLTDIQARPDENGGVRYEIEELAYPHSAVIRFFTRQLGLVERFFRSKTREIEDLAVVICRRLLEPTFDATAVPPAPSQPPP